MIAITVDSSTRFNMNRLLSDGYEMAPTVTAEARLRDRNQITIPDAIVRAAGIEPGETFVVELEPGEPDMVRLRRVRTSYAGALTGLYGDVATYLDEERASWE